MALSSTRLDRTGVKRRPSLEVQISENENGSETEALRSAGW